MHDYQPESFLLLFLYHLEFHKSQEVWETVNLVTQILLMWMAQDPCSFSRVFILHDNIQALCVAALSAEEQGVVFKNNLKGFTLGINFHTLFFLLFSSCYQKLWCVISPSSSISYSTWKHPQKSVHDVSQNVNTQRIQGKYAGLLQCFEEGGFINCQSRRHILSCLP